MSYTLFKENPLKLTQRHKKSLEFALYTIAYRNNGYFISGETTDILERYEELGFPQLKQAERNSAEAGNGVINEHLNKYAGDFGIGGIGFFTGLVSRNIEIEPGDKGLWKLSKQEDGSKKKVNEHIFTRDIAWRQWDLDNLTGVWDVDFDESNGGRIKGITDGKTHIEQVYPRLLTTTWTTSEENNRLKTIVQRMKRECTSNTGLDVPRLIERLENAEHYKEANIRFYPSTYRFVGHDKMWPQLICEEFHKLMSKTKAKTSKRGTLDRFLQEA